MESEKIPIFTEETSEDFWKPLYFFLCFVIFLLVVYIYAAYLEAKDFREVKQTLLIDEAANESHRHFIISVS